MKEINTLLEWYQKTEDKTAALATVIDVEGSSYRRTGARMLIYETGDWKGGISGGCLEKDVLKNAKLVMLEQKARTIRYDTNQDSPNNIGVSLGCNGIIDIIISPLKKGHSRNPLEVLKNCTESRTANLLITVIKNETSLEVEKGEMFRFQDNQGTIDEKGLMTIFKNEKIASKVVRDIEVILKGGKTRIIDYQLEENKKISLLFEILQPNTHLILVGNNYDIYPLSDLAKVLGWKVSVVANPFKLDKSIFKTAKIFAAQKGRTLSIETDSNTAVILMSHDYETDLSNLKHFLPSDVGYIGLLGPRKRGDKLIRDLKKENIDLVKAQVARLFTPTGLDIGANTPEEIALSILAEIRAFFSHRKGGFLIEREGPIHERT